MSIYKGLNVRDEIESHIFQETLLLFMEAASKGIAQSEWPDVPDEFINQLRTNTRIWAAFRTHRMQNDIASKLLDEDGKLKKFDRWVEDIKGMTNHYVGPWLRTEYNTAVLRAHQAADWKHFEAEADIFPNVRWMPTTSPQQDPLHRQYWEKKLTLPVNHPFWSEHRPGDRWNCKCTLQQTDDPVNDEVIREFYPVPQQPGLDNNPADDGKLFSDSHPYIAKAYAGADKAVSNAVGTVVDFVPAKTIEEAEKFARQYCQRLGIDRTFKGEISYKGISLDNANEINRALKQVMETVDVPKISGIKPISGSSKTGQKIFKDGADAVAAYDPVSKGIYLNTDVLKSAKAFTEYQKRAQEAWDKVMSNLDKLSPEMREIAERYKKAGRSLVDPSVKGCIIHELGHHVQWTKMPANLINSIKDIAANSVKISGYAGATKGEYIAESFASWMKGEKRIAKDLQDFFDSIAKNSMAEPNRIINKRQKTEAEKEEIRRRWNKRGYRIDGIRQLPAGDGQSKALTKAVADVEKDIRMNKSFETGVLFDTDGNILIDKRGKSYSVSFSADEIKKMKNNILTHNHPRGWQAKPDLLTHIGSSFSDADLDTAVSADLLEIRAVGPLYTYSMKRPAKGWGVTGQTVKRAYKAEEQRVQTEMWQAIRAGQITPIQASAMHFHLVNKRLAKKFGWEYSKAKTR